MASVYNLSPDLWMPQARGLLQVMDRLSAGKDVCLYSPTGSGKTRMAIELFKWAEYLGIGGCFYVNRRLLIGQTASRFAASGLDYGIRAAGYEDEFREHAPFQICSADTEASRVIKRGVWKLHKCGLVVVDEAHIQRTDTMRWLLMNHRDSGARIVLLTATPIGLSDWCDELVVSGKMQEYRDCKALVPAIVKSIEQPDLRKVKRNATGEYVIDGEKRKIYTQSIVGSVIARWKEFNPDARPTMLYAPGVPESVWFTEQFRKQGVNWCHVDATDAIVDGSKYALDRPLWDDICNRFKDGSIKGISSRFKCLDRDTEILTVRGWLGIDSLSQSDQVASVDIASKQIRWVNPTRVIRQEHSGDFYTIKNDSLDVRVTDDHTLIVRSLDRRCSIWKREEAREAAKRRGAMQIPVAVAADAPDMALSDSAISLLGWMLTDGHIRKDTGGLVISQSMSQPQIIHDHIVDTLNGCGVKWVCSDSEAWLNGKQYSDCRNYRVSRSEIERVGLSVYMDKDMHPDLMHMSRRQLLVLLKSVNYADGCKRKNPSWTVSTLEIFKGNLTFLGRLQALCVTRGMRANIHPRHSGACLYITPDRDYATVRGQTNSETDGHKRVRLILEASSGSQPVWCVEVPDGVIITRRNGKVAVVGNCREGIDFPFAYHVIMATPIGSLASYLQTVGRVLRYSTETPEHVLVTDHGGNYWRHGSPNVDRDWQDWWALPEHVVSEIHTNDIRDGKKPESLVCPQCFTERTGGRKCPICGFEHDKSKRRVLQESGKMVEYEGNLIPPRRIKNKPDTADLWAKLYWGFKKKKVDRSFEQMYAYFAHQYHYHPPRDLPYMPKNKGGWCALVHSVPFRDLHEKPQN